MIACLSNLDWDVLRYRKQHLMARLARHEPVVYVNPPRACKARNVLRAGRTHPLDVRLWVHEPRVMPGMRRFSAARRLTYALIARELRRAHGGRGSLVLWIYSPHALPVLDLLASDAVVYDVADAHATPSGPRLRDDGEAREIDALARREAALASRADLVLCVSEPLVERFTAAGHAAHLVPNGCDWDCYAAAAPRPGPRGPRPKLGFVGAVAPRVDLDLISAVARARPSWDVEIVGPVSPLVDVAPLRALSNVRVAGPVPYAQVPSRIASYDVCLLPLHHIEFAWCSSPIQVYDYLAAGKPVVSTPVAQFERLPTLVRTAAGPVAFVNAVERALGTDSAGAIAERRAFAMANSWDERVTRIRGLLDDLRRARTQGVR